MSLRTRLANSGCDASNSAQEATRRRYAGACQQLIDAGRRNNQPQGKSTAGAEVPIKGQDARNNPGTRTLKPPMADPGPPAASAENAFAANLFEELPARYDRLAEVLSLGQSAKWRHELVHHIARMKPRRVLDVATGTASVAIALAKATVADIVGVDISEPMLEMGRKRVDAAGLDRRIRLQHARAEQLPFPSASFDAVSFTYLLRYVADPSATLRELGRVLRPGGAM